MFHLAAGPRILAWDVYWTCPPGGLGGRPCGLGPFLT